jgi:gamma-aminobutyric acid receptor subunit beta
MKNKTKTEKKTRITIIKVGYTMRDIRYKWNEGPNSVGVSSEVSLPQFKVLGHRQRAMEISLTTGRSQSVDRTSA